VQSLSIVIPALNEEQGIAQTIRSIPVKKLREMGFGVEIIVVDNGSIDQTLQVAETSGAKIVRESQKGYGRAYRAGFREVQGEIIATGDADSSYPFYDLPRLLDIFINEDLDFLTTNRFHQGMDIPMRGLNKIGNLILNAVFQLFYGNLLQDSQSGMWIFKRELLDKMRLHSLGMPFSQEIKIEACFYLKVKYSEVPINYSKRVGKVKLRRVRDGLENLAMLAFKRFIR